MISNEDSLEPKMTRDEAWAEYRAASAARDGAAEASHEAYERFRKSHLAYCDANIRFQKASQALGEESPEVFFNGIVLPELKRLLDGG